LATKSSWYAYRKCIENEGLALRLVKRSEREKLGFGADERHLLMAASFGDEVRSEPTWGALFGTASLRRSYAGGGI